MCWLVYVMNRKRKAERYAQAMKRYRSRLLHIGVTQWIEVYTDVDLHTLCVLVYVEFLCACALTSLPPACKLRERNLHCSTKHRYVHYKKMIDIDQIKCCCCSGHAECDAVRETVC